MLPSPPSRWNEFWICVVVALAPLCEIQATDPLGRYVSVLIGIAAITATGYMIGHARGAAGWGCALRHRWAEVARAPVTLERWEKPPLSFDYERCVRNVPGVMVLERCSACGIERGFRDAGDTRTVVSGVYARSRLEEWGVLATPSEKATA